MARPEGSDIRGENLALRGDNLRFVRWVAVMTDYLAGPKVFGVANVHLDLVRGVMYFSPQRTKWDNSQGQTARPRQSTILATQG